MNHVEMLMLAQLRDKVADMRDSEGAKARDEEHKEYDVAVGEGGSPEVAKLKEQVQLLTKQVHRERTIWFHKGKAEAGNEFVSSLSEIIRAADKDLKG